MEVVISKWGNSLGLRIPHQLANDFKLVSGSRVNIASAESQFIVKPVASLETLFETHYNKPMKFISRSEIGLYDEVNWGEDVGGEIIT